MTIIVSLFLVLIGILTIAIFVIVVLSSTNLSSDDNNRNSVNYPTQNLNVNGHIRHNHKDINSY